MNKFIHHEGRLNNIMQKWKKEKEKEKIIISWHLKNLTKHERNSESDFVVVYVLAGAAALVSS